MALRRGLRASALFLFSTINISYNEEVIIMDNMFRSIDLLRECIRILNFQIEKFGYVDIEHMDMVCQIPNYVPKYTDTQFGWTEKFSESNIEVERLLDGTIVFIFKITEPKEL